MISLATNIPNISNASVEIPKSILLQGAQVVMIKTSLNPNQPLVVADQLRIAEWSGLALTESMYFIKAVFCME